MPVDFDGLVNTVCVETFGEKGKQGPARYTPKVGEAFDLDGIFDQAWQQVAMRQTGRMGLAPVSTTKPAFTVREKAFPDGVTPHQGEGLVLANGDAYTVAEVQPDGFGMFYLLLN